MKTIQALMIMCVLGCQLQAQVSFKLSSSPGAGSDPNWVAAADVNGDGEVDLISANYYGSSLSVLTNNGSGGFVVSGTYTVGTYPIEVVTADVNRDGKTDLICANSGDGTLSVLTNNASGGFVLAGTYSVGTGPLSVAAVDVNGDGKVDLITANWGSAGEGNTLTVLTNNGSNGFVFASTLTVGSGPVWVAAADVNGDGKVDLVTANWGNAGGGNTLTVLTNNGSGGFVLSGTYTVGTGPRCVIAADVNGDGKVDLVTANWGDAGGGNTLTVLTNNGSGIFGSNATINVVSGPFMLTAADVNGDGKVDLVSANVYGDSLSVFTNNGSGGFVLATNLSVAGNVNSVTAVDVNGDGKVDLICPLYPNNVLDVFTNATPFSQPLPPPLGSPIATGMATMDSGFVVSVIVTYGGYGYTNTPRVLIDPPFIPNPVLGIAPMSFLSFSNLTVGGVYQLQQSFQWYWTNQSGSFTASNALFTQMVAGAVGSGNYRLALNPAPAQAFATPQVVNGFVVGATVTSGGSGYVTSPGVSIVGGHGTNATAVSHISGGVVTSISIVSPGAGYTNTPMVEIAPPPAAAVSPTVFPVLRVDSANLAPYYNYQIQFKPDITAPWINWGGGLFSPTDITNSQFIFITNSAGFFRLQYVP